MRTSNRVLTRLGARELTVDEAAMVGGAIAVHTNVCTAPIQATLTGPDGDGCGHGDFDAS